MVVSSSGAFALSKLRLDGKVEERAVSESFLQELMFEHPEVLSAFLPKVAEHMPEE